MSADAATPMTVDSFHRSRRYVNLRFGRIAVVERGVGKAALFLHGYPLNGFQWRGCIDRLHHHRRCIAPDFMGLGYSEVAADQSLALKDQAAMVAELLDALKVDRVDLVANDSGGATAQLFATRHPRRVRSMLLTNCDTQDDSPPPTFLPIIAAAKAGKLADGLARQFATPALVRSTKGFGGQNFMDPSHLTDEVLQCYVAPLVSTPLRRTQFEAFAIALEHNPLEGIEPALRALQVPTRIVWGDADTVFSQGAAEWLNRTLPRSLGVRHVPGAKLFFPEELPDLVAEETMQLWRHSE